MKILIINLDKNIFKADSRSLNDLKDYSRFFDKLFIISWTREKEKPIFYENRLFVYPTNSSSRLFYIFDTCRIFRKFIKKEKIDLVSSQDPFETGFAAFLISRFFKISLHLQAHTDFLSPYFRKGSPLNCFRVLIAKFLIPRADCIRVVSSRIKMSLKKLCHKPKKEAIVLPIFVDIEKIKKAMVKTDLHKKYPQFDFIILMASRLTAEKNINLAIKAMKEICDTNIRMHANDANNANKKNVGLIIVGEGTKEKKLKACSSKIKTNVMFEPWTENLASYYKTADLFLLTSNFEGYGRTVVEAMAGKCPVIMTDVGLAGEVLIDKKDGLVIPVGNKKKLVEGILKLIENRELRAELIRNEEKIMNFWPSKEGYLKAYRESWLSCKKV